MPIPVSVAAKEQRLKLVMTEDAGIGAGERVRISVAMQAGLAT